MLEIHHNKKFVKSIKKSKKSGLYKESDFVMLKSILFNLINNIDIETMFKRHSLTGNMKGFEAIHIKNDWVLVFSISDNTLNLLNIGTHSQVYKKF